MESKAKERKISKALNAVWQKFLSFFKKDNSVDKKPLKTHSKFFALVAVQYRDKVDTSWSKSLKTIIQKVVFTVLKFVLIFAVVAAMLLLVAKLFMISTQILDFFLIFLGFYTILNLISVTVGLVKSLYHADDNKVLATYPISSTKLFLSKILVFELIELKKSFDILLPISLGFLFAGVQKLILPSLMMVWSIVPLFLIVSITVLLGALLSIPTLYVYNFLKKRPLIEGILLAAIIAGVVYGIIYTINLIPENKGDIDIQKSYSLIKQGIENFSAMFAKIVYPVNFAFRAIVGEAGNFELNKFTWLTIGRIGIMVLVALALFGLVFLIIKPFYFGMMTKTFEFDKNIVSNAKQNKRKERHWSIIVKEMKLTLRDLDISGSYLAVYIAVPVLLLFIDKIFAAMSTNARGDFLVATFNIILILLPLLASSTVIATVYSREGRTAYIKKTKPIKPYFPLVAKLIFNFVFVIPSIGVASWVFSKFTNQSNTSAILLSIAVLCMQYGHIFFSASLDIMNPQNELYATEGSSFANPNERKSTILAFIITLLFAAIALLLFRESQNKFGNLENAFVKLLVLSILFACSCITLFFLKVKAFYIDRQEASRE